MPFDASPRNVRRVALCVAIGGLLAAGHQLYHAASNEMSGTACYVIGIGRTAKAERVTREQSPKKFRVATNELWGWGSFFLLVSIGSFIFYRRLDDTLAEPF